jgi:peptidyl-prolyl cis-trans isomerase B (cyclophilin B)
MQERISNRVIYTPEIREAYKTLGGTPHLDGAYTVFGQVIEGLEVIDAIQKVATDENNRPIEDVRILRAVVEK